MKKHILFFHSAEIQGLHSGSGPIVSYLQEYLNQEYELISPRMPDPERPRYEEWKGSIMYELARLHEEVVLVGHSLGGSVLLKYLSEGYIENCIRGLFLIAPPYWGKDQGWSVEDFKLKSDYASKLPGIPGIFLYHSRDDEWVPFSHSIQYAEELPQVTFRKFGVRGHNFTTGFPELIRDIKSLNT